MIGALAQARAWVQSPVRAVVLLGAIAVSMILIATALYLNELRGDELRHAAREATSISKIIGDQTTRALQSVDLVVGGLAERIGQMEQRQISSGDLPVHAMLKARIEGMPHIDALFLLDAQGTLVNGSAEFPVSKVRLAAREYFQFHRTHSRADLYVGPPLVSLRGSKRSLHVSRRVSASDGRFGGVVVAALNLDYFEQLHDLKLEYITPISLYLSDGHLVTRTPRNEEMISRTIELPPAAAGGDNGDLPRTVHLTGDSPGVVIYRDIARFPLTLMVASMDSAALAGWRQNALKVWLGAATVAIFIALITLLLFRELKRKQILEENLARTDETLRAMINTAMDAIVTVDENNRIVLFNPAAEEMFGCAAGHAMGASLARFLPERYRSAHEQHIAGFHDGRRSARAMSNEVVGLRASGEEFPVESTISKVNVAGRTLFTAVLRDISERHRAEMALNTSNAELRRLSESLIQVREDERTRIARELHDELGQHLMRLRLDLSSLAGRLRSSHPELEAKVQVMKGLLADTVTSVRRLTTELRPPLLDDLGLVAAAEWLANDFSQRSGIGVEVAIDPAADDCEAGMATAVYRILQEALTNVGRHATASHVGVTLDIDDDTLRLAIEDNGRGMHPASSEMFCAGNGLVGMRERVLMFSGRLDVGSSAVGGVAIEVYLPLNARSAVGHIEETRP